MPAPHIVGTPETVYNDGAVKPVTFTKPAGLQVGDILVAWMRSQGSDWASDWSIPSGFSRVGPAFIPSNATSRVGGWFRHVVTDLGSEPASYTFDPPSGTGASRRLGVLVVVRNALTSPSPSGTVGNYHGTNITGGRQAASFGPANLTGEQHLVLFAGNSEFGSPNNHVPTGTPTGYSQIAEVVGPSPSTAISRSYCWVGTKVIEADDMTGTADITWATGAGGPQVQSIAFQGLPSSELPPLAYNGLGEPLDIYVTTAEGPKRPKDLRYITKGYSDIDEMLNSPNGFYWAHRGGSASFSEMSLHAYTQSVVRYFGALEISLNRSSDGVWFGLHDQNLDRTSQVTLGITDAGSMTWAEIQAYQITIGAAGAPRPYMTWDELIEAYGDSHILICDPKYRHSSHRSEFLAKCFSDIGTDRCIVKFSYDATSLKTAIANAGLMSWGYLYQSNLSDPDFESKCSGWDLLGMEYTASQETWDTVLEFNKPVVAHICPNESAVTTARSKGASGFQVSGTSVVKPY